DVDVKVAAADALPTDADTYDVAYTPVTVQAGGAAGTSTPSFTDSTGAVGIPTDTKFELAAGTPDWVKIDENTGVVTLTPGEDVDPGSETIQVVVTYADDSSENADVAVTVTAAEVPAEPTEADTYAVTYRGVEVQAGKSETSEPEFTLAADGSDTDVPLGASFALAAGAPSWATIDSTTGVVTVAPDAEVSATNVNLEVVVTYADASTDRAGFAVNVTAAPAEPSDNEVYDVTYGPVTVKAGGEAGTSTPSFTDENGPAAVPAGTEFELAAGAPDWVSIDPTTGVVTLTPGENVDPGSETIQVVVTYADATTDTAAVSVTVTPADVDPAPSLTGDPKAVDPTDESQDTGLNIVDGDESDVVAKDEDGNYLPVDVDNDGNISVTPGVIDGPITVIVNENDPDNREEREVPVNRGEVPPVDDGSSTGSSDFLQQCLNSPAAGVAGLLIALGTVGAIAGPALEPLMKSIGAELDRQLRTLINATGGANQPEWVRNINRGLNDAANAVDHRMVSQALFATAALALISTPVLCGMDNSSSSSS
ncbi:Rib/alpha-like domain-containing protein, partial [Corynebacterium glutamicum]|uniref:Rib/alpha-like domain-containing protein n=1 Tax=Corynebacterium glutamicum TaxID=1718 RepID=UPI00095B867F